MLLIAVKDWGEFSKVGGKFPQKASRIIHCVNSSNSSHSTAITTINTMYYYYCYCDMKMYENSSCWS